MRNKLSSLIIGAALVGTMTIGTHVSAEQIEVNKGDTLWNIAKENGTTVNELKEINNLANDIIHPNQLIETSTEEEDAEITYVVKSGDTLSGIGLNFDVEVDEIKEWNELDSDLININQELLIKGVEEESATETVEPKAEKAVEPAQETKAETKTETKEERKEKSTEQPQEQKQESSASGQSMTMEATAYTAECYGCSGVTATGIDLNNDRHAKVVAVDPSVIPLGSRVHVEGYGEAIAGDTGGAIKGNRIDLHLPTKDAAFGFGRQNVKVTVLD